MLHQSGERLRCVGAPVFQSIFLGNTMSNKQTCTLSNFRLRDVIPNWPLGANKRGDAVFEHESNKRGQRISRTTSGKPKRSTYYVRACLADGSDGRTYYIGLSVYGNLSVMQCDMQYSAFYIARGEDNYAEYLNNLFLVAGDLVYEN